MEACLIYLPPDVARGVYFHERGVLFAMKNRSGCIYFLKKYGRGGGGGGAAVNRELFDNS